jgi:hypothetical protein
MSVRRPSDLEADDEPQGKFQKTSHNFGFDDADEESCPEIEDASTDDEGDESAEEEKKKKKAPKKAKAKPKKAKVKSQTFDLSGQHTPHLKKVKKINLLQISFLCRGWC